MVNHFAVLYELSPTILSLRIGNVVKGIKQ